MCECVSKREGKCVETRGEEDECESKILKKVLLSADREQGAEGVCVCVCEWVWKRRGERGNE